MITHPPNLTADRLTERIISTTVEAYGLDRYDVLSDCREAPLVRARQVGMYVTRELTSLSLPKIARRFNRKDHTTVLHALGRVRNDPKLLAEANELIAFLAAPEVAV